MDQSSPAMMQTLVMTFLDSEIGFSCSSFSFCTTTLFSLRLSLRCAFTLHTYYFIAFDLVNSSCTPAADGFAITKHVAVTFPHFYFSRSARLTADSGFTLHQYYFIEVDLVNCVCTTSVLFHWQLGSSRSAKGFLTNLEIALQQYFFMECVQHLFASLQNYMAQQGQPDSPRRRTWEEHQFHGLLPVIWPEAKPKTSRTDYGKRLSRETSRFSDQIMARGQADKPLVFCFFFFVFSFVFLFFLTMLLPRPWTFKSITSGRWIAALHPYYLIAFNLMNCSCAPSADGSVTTGDDADLDDDISTGRNWIELQQIQFLRYNRAISLRLILRSASTLRPYYLIACDLVNSSYTPSADGSAITKHVAVTFPHFYFSRSARLTADSGFTLHQYYFIEVDLVNCFCTTSVLFHWQRGRSRSAQGCSANLGFALHQYFGVEFVQHLFSKSQGSTGIPWTPQECERTTRSMDFSQ